MKKQLKKIVSQRLRYLKLLKHHLKQLSFSDNLNKKRIIICFNGVVPHGGLVDRLKGVISFYDVATTLDYEFYIQFNNPFSLQTFLEPNQYDWSIKNEAVTYNPTSTKIISIINDFDVNPFQIIEKSKANTFLVYSNIDYLSKMHKKLSDDELSEKWRNHFNTLFKKSDLLEQKLNKVSTQLFNSFHTRFTSIMGDFADTTSYVISESEKEVLLLKLKNKVTELTNISNLPYYAFSDSSIFLNYISKECSVNLIEGQPFHMDNFKGDSSLEAHLKTLLDFFMIAKSKKVYFLKADKMYDSAFSKYAAIVGDKPFQRIEV